jgi:hypothetical protein
VLTGSLTPDRLERLAARKLIGPMHFALLDCPDNLLAGRLRARPGMARQIQPGEDHRESTVRCVAARPHHASFDTSAASAAEVASQVAAWVKALLPGTQAPS